MRLMGNSTFEEEIQRTGELVYTNVGYSMMPLIRQHRDLVVIKKPQGRCRKYDVPLYKRADGKYILHRILAVRPQDYVIRGDNCWKKEYGITDSQIVGVLSAVVRDGKTIPVTDWRYQAYARLWHASFPARAAFLPCRVLLGRIRRKLRK